MRFALPSLQGFLLSPDEPVFETNQVVAGINGWIPAKSAHDVRSRMKQLARPHRLPHHVANPWGCLLTAWYLVIKFEAFVGVRVASVLLAHRLRIDLEVPHTGSTDNRCQQPAAVLIKILTMIALQNEMGNTDR
ncbi:hypothetical protein EsDP_00001100 [Epichloe bromicola]|uniref:Uncharacterized protein n=1 Tax=Epichloe bromicola TaxID=79588 RepID=A0ABQ0CGV1_9HYPO